MPLSERTIRVREALRRAEAVIDDRTRYVDCGIRLHTVRQAPEGEVVIPGTTPVSVIRSRDFGGTIDTKTRRLVGPSRAPISWYCSEDQEPYVIHGAPLSNRVLLYGAMGSGKTSVLGMWLVLRSLDLVHRGFTGARRELFGGGTAPTRGRRDTIVNAIRNLCPAEWYKFLKLDCEFRLCWGVTLELRATKEQSSEVGVPIQGQNWCFCGSDEIQDSVAANPHIEARGRSAPGGNYYRLCTATAKDSHQWRQWRSERFSTGQWDVRRLEGRANPFVPASWWNQLKAELSERDYQRIVLAQDVGPERMVYTSFSREHNLQPVPRLGAHDVTRDVLRPYGNGNLTMLGGHDPGSMQNTTILLKAYKFPNTTRHVWYVVDEVITRATTTEEHAIVLRNRLREKWSLNLPDLRRRSIVDPLRDQVHLRCDPHGNTETSTHRTVYAELANQGFNVRSAVYDSRGRGSGRLPKEAGIEMVNRLFCSADGTRRLYIACDEGGPAAPTLLRSIEMNERDEFGRAEQYHKGNKTKDLSDEPAALRYALWQFERTRRLAA